MRGHQMGVPNQVLFDIDDTLFDTDTIKELRLEIINDLFKLQWEMVQDNNSLIVRPPKEYSKDAIRKCMSYKRNELLKDSEQWIAKNLFNLRNNMATGEQALSSAINPEIEVCVTKKQHDLFRICRYSWSSPYSDYVGRRIKLIIRDGALSNRPIIGIAALGSPIIHIPERDTWVGWNKTVRTANLNNCMDAYVVGALPPYNHLLGGKLISYILASNEIRQIYFDKYGESDVNARKSIDSSNLVCLFTTSLYGRSSQYNRIKYMDQTLFHEIGKTKGYGSLHISEKTFRLMIHFLKENGILIPNSFGSGPNWRMRVIREAAKLLKIDANLLLAHSFKRTIYATPLADNFKEVLLGVESDPIYYNYPMEKMVSFWKNRWLHTRKEYLRINSLSNDIRSFSPNEFVI